MEKETLKGGKEQKLAVFDVCGTLFRSNTSYDFLSFLHQDKPLAQVLLFLKDGLPIRALNRFSIQLFSVDLLRALLTFFLLRRAQRPQLEKAAHQFVTQYLPTRQVPETHQLLEDLRNQGYRIILLSASYSFIVTEIATTLSIQEYFASTLGYRYDKCTGVFHEDLLFKKASFFADRFPDSHSQLVVVTDNKTDLPLLQQADRAIIICCKKDRSFWCRHLKNPEFLPVK